MYLFLVSAFILMFGNASGFIADFFRSWDACPLKWTKFYGCDFSVEFQGTCFCLFPHTPLTFEQANNFCENLDGHLAMPKTKEISDFLVKELLSSYGEPSPIWIGLHDKEEEGKFVWVDGTPVRWTNWVNRCSRRFASEDEQQVEDCVEMSPANNGSWEDFECSSKTFKPSLKRTFMCQYRPDGTESDVEDQSSADDDEGDNNDPCEDERKDDIKKEDVQDGQDGNDHSGKERTDEDEVPRCPEFECNLNCYLDGYVTDSTTGCPLCQCDNEK